MKKTFKKLLSILMVFAMLFGMVPTQAFAAEDYTWDSGTKTLTIHTNAGLTDWTSDTTFTKNDIVNLVVDATVTDAVGSGTASFEEAALLETVEFKGAVTVAENAFYKCGKLHTVSFAGTSNIGKLAFASCYDLKTVTFGGAAQIGEEAFYYAGYYRTGGMDKIVIPAGSSIANDAFYCASVTEVEIQNTDTINVGNYAFAHCGKLTKITFAGPANIGYEAFTECYMLKTVTFGGAAQIGEEAFYYAGYYQTGGMDKIVIPAGSSIANNAFYSASVTEVEIQNTGTINVGNYAFAHCGKLTKITFAGPANIGYEAFTECTMLKTVTFGGAAQIGEEAFLYAGYYQTDGMDKIVIPAGSSIANDAFNSASVTEVEIQNTDTINVGNYAFAHCGKLTKITFDGKADLGSSVFKDSGADSTVYKFKSETAGFFGNKAFDDGKGTIYVTCPAYEGSIASMGTNGANPDNLPVEKMHVIKLINAGDEGHYTGCVGCDYAVEESMEQHAFDNNEDTDCECGYVREISAVQPAVALDKTEITLTVGETATLIPTITPADLPNYALSWASDPESVATVDYNGTVTAVAAGTATITVTLMPGAMPTDADDPVLPTASCEVTVVPADVPQEPTTSVTVVKEWNVPEGTNIPGFIEVYLLANGQQVGDTPVRLTADDDWAYTFENLPIANEEGKAIEYTVAEVEIEGFESSVGEAIETDTGIEIAITNSLKEEGPEDPETVTVSGTKTWVGDEENYETVRPDRIIVNLIVNNEVIDETEATRETQWTYSFGDLPKYDEAGNEIEYTVQEEAVENYTASYDGFNITNTLNDEDDKEDEDEEGGNGGTTTPSRPSKPSSPATGDISGTPMYLAALAVAAVSLVFVLKKKKDIE